MSNNVEQRIEFFFKSHAFGVIGASNNRNKYGNKVLRAYLQNNKKVYPVNPNENMIEGISCLADIQQLPLDVSSISIITPPHITEQIVQKAAARGIKNVWMQPGAESNAAIQFCEENNINVIAKGPCVLVALQFHED